MIARDAPELVVDERHELIEGAAIPAGIGMEKLCDRAGLAHGRGAGYRDHERRRKTTRDPAIIAFVIAPILLAGLLSAAAVDERAIAVEAEMIEAMGGRKNWEEARFIRFTFVRGDRKPSFSWDRWTGRLRIESRNRGGVPYVVLMNVKTRQGKVFLEGRPLDGAELSEYVNLSYRMWKGETYWFLMPFKWLDDGVELAHEAEETLNDVVYDKIRVTFDDGRSPGDSYLAYVNRETHLMDRWVFRLNGGAEGDYRWRNWHRYGGLRVATERVSDDEIIRFEDIFVGASLPDSIFTSPEPVALP